MKEEVRKAIAECSQQIDNLERTRNLISTSNVLCFTTMDRGPEETVSIEFVEKPETRKDVAINVAINLAKDGMVEYINSKIRQLNERIDKIAEEGV